MASAAGPFTAGLIAKALPSACDWAPLASRQLVHSAAAPASRPVLQHVPSCSHHCHCHRWSCAAVHRLRLLGFGSGSGRGETASYRFAHRRRQFSGLVALLSRRRSLAVYPSPHLRSLSAGPALLHGFGVRLSPLTGAVTRTMASRAGTGAPHSDTSHQTNGRLSKDDMPRSSDYLLPYNPAEWMQDLKNIPKHRVKLVYGVTPIQRWYLPNVPGDFEISIKRDDLTGCELSGNKARKLEFLLADAIQQGCSAIITCGSTQSNHCRATAVAARQLGLEPHLLLRSPVSDIEEVTCKGNMLLNRLIGAHVHLMPKKAQFATDIRPRLDQLVEKIKEETGEKAYPIIIGGSCAVGLFGYLEAFKELQQQGVAERFTDIVIACGSNGSTLGLALANYLTGSRLKVHGMIVSDDAKFHFGGMNEVLRRVDARDGSGKVLRAQDIVHLVEGVKGLGYGLSTPEELDTVAEICTKTGIIIDPVYTGKSIRHLLRLAREKPATFKGNKILFVHTGGIFGLFDGRMDDTITRHGLEQHRLHEWMELGEQAPDMDL